MSTLYYLFSICAALFIIRWFIKNDGRTSTSGILAMKKPANLGHNQASTSNSPRL